MKRSVLGIVVVFCLQLGFIAYSAIDRPIETLIAVNDVTEGTNPLAIIPETPETSEFFVANSERSSSPVDNREITVSEPDRRHVTRAVAAAPVSPKKTRRAPAAREVNGMPLLVAVRKPAEPRLRTEYPKERESKNYQLSSRAIPQQKKKSFFSKSLSILKKPYDWLKAIGSRLK
jgi:hypothetical protein